jgi:hypothetical protein
MMRMDVIVERLRAWGGGARDWAARRGLDWRHGAAAGGVLLAGGVVVGLAGAVSGGRPAADAGRRLQIEIVQPVEPVFTAGPTMEVGTLVDGFDPSLMAAPEPPEAAYDDVDQIEPGTKDEGGPSRRLSSAVGREDHDDPRLDRRSEREAYDRHEAERREPREPRRRMVASPRGGREETPVG